MDSDDTNLPINPGWPGPICQEAGVNMREIPLTRGYVAQVDDEDYSVLSKMTWSLREQSGHRYAFHSFRRGNFVACIYMHRLVLGMTGSTGEVDHIDNCGLNNQKGNLRVCTHRDNMRNNSKRKGKHQFKGIWRDGDGWRAQINVDGKKRHSGKCPTQEEAARQYDNMARLHYGEFARVNFPQANEQPALSAA